LMALGRKAMWSPEISLGRIAYYYPNTVRQRTPHLRPAPVVVQRTHLSPPHVRPILLAGCSTWKDKTQRTKPRLPLRSSPRNSAMSSQTIHIHPCRTTPVEPATRAVEARTRSFRSPPGAAQAMMSLTILPAMPVRRTSRPWNFEFRRW
jgi:hypothetical protein